MNKSSKCFALLSLLSVAGVMVNAISMPEVENFDTNTINVEKMPRLGEYVKINLNAGETICFNGNKCNHNNEINKTGFTRVSFDFRVLPLNYYQSNYEKTSASTNTKYIEGGYLV